LPSRTDAIRRLVELGLKVKRVSRIRQRPVELGARQSGLDQFTLLPLERLGAGLKA